MAVRAVTGASSGSSTRAQAVKTPMPGPSCATSAGPTPPTRRRRQFGPQSRHEFAPDDRWRARRALAADQCDGRGEGVDARFHALISFAAHGPHAVDDPAGLERPLQKRRPARRHRPLLRGLRLLEGVVDRGREAVGARAVHVAHGAADAVREEPLRLLPAAVAVGVRHEFPVLRREDAAEQVEMDASERAAQPDEIRQIRIADIVVIGRVGRYDRAIGIMRFSS